METLQWENVNRDKFAVFLRDLTENSKINLKHMIEDLDKTETSSVKKDTKHTSKKGKKKSVVLVEYPRKGSWAVGFATKENKGEIKKKVNKILKFFVLKNLSLKVLCQYPLL